MRIAHVTPVYPPERGGMGQVAYEYVTRLRTRGHDVHVFTLGSRRRAEETEAPPHLRLLHPWIRIGNAGVVPTLSRALRTFDLIHVHYPFFGGAEFLLRARVGRTIPPVVLSYHMDALGRGLKGRLFHQHHKRVLPRILPGADRLLVSSGEYAESSMLAAVPGALDRIEVHPFGVDSDRFSPGRDGELRATLRIAADVPVLLFVGALDAAHAFKGLDVLFRALARLDRLNWRLVIVGTGNRQSAAACAARERLGPRVQFVGGIDGETLPRYYRAADVHVLPSTTRSESFGLVTLEAAASGIPSVVSDLPGVRTNVISGITGLLVPPGDDAALETALRGLLLSREQRQALGAAARAQAVDLKAWSPLIDRLERLYQDLVPPALPRGWTTAARTARPEVVPSCPTANR